MPLRVDRRGFLTLMGPALLLPVTPLRVRAQAAEDALFLLVDGIDTTTPPDLIDAVLDPFLEGEIPFALVLPPLGPDSPLPSAATLRRVLAAGPMSVEPVLALPGLPKLPIYFQRRMASDSIQALARLAPDSAAPLSIATDGVEETNLDALRCLGIRTVLKPDLPLPVASAGCAGLAVCLSGVTRINMADAADPAAQMEPALSRPGWAQIALSLAGIERATPAEARLRGRRAVDAVLREVELGRRFLALPRDNALWFGPDQPRFLALRLAASGPEAEVLARDLRALGLPLTPTLAPVPEPVPADACLQLPGTGGLPAGPICAAAPDAMAVLPEESSVELLLLPSDHAAFDGRGLLVRGETPVAEAARLLDPAEGMRDAVLSIGPEAVLTPQARAATLDLLARLRADPGTRLLDVPGFVQATVTPDPVFALWRDSRRAAGPASSDEPEPAPLTPEEWLADAAQAWQFFQRFSNPDTGLCADTADVQEGEAWLHRELTMWDLGSLIAGVMAAQELGLLSDADFVARADQLVRALPVARIGGLQLPCEVISSDSGRALSSDFNACDTGRLLSVLRELDAHPLTAGLAESTVDTWDLAGVIADGRVHSVVDGRLVDRFRSHCAHYTARAFRDRGFAVASPYEVPDEASPTDHAMRLLHAAGDLGPLGAEPLLFEAVEMGLSAPSDVLAQVLFAAQRLEFERSGTLLAVSEAPLNRQPWFSYQGLNLTGAGDRWMVNVTSDDARYATAEFRREITLVNTKAAYLWAAHRPDTWSTRLVRHVRDRARIEGAGFSPGVHVASGLGMSGYADINTNGVVLEAVAFILRGRKPRLG